MGKYKDLIWKTLITAFMIMQIIYSDNQNDRICKYRQEIIELKEDIIVLETNHVEQLETMKDILQVINSSL